MSENIVDEKDVANVISFMEYFNFKLVDEVYEGLGYLWFIYQKYREG